MLVTEHLMLDPSPEYTGLLIHIMTRTLPAFFHLAAELGDRGG
jgi:hypothetical protein